MKLGVDSVTQTIYTFVHLQNFVRNAERQEIKASFVLSRVSLAKENMAEEFRERVQNITKKNVKKKLKFL